MAQRYKVPQDLLKAEKVFGPLTMKNFAFLCIAGAISYSLTQIFDDQTWPIPVVVIMIFALCYVFWQPHGMPFHKYMVVKMLYLLRPRKRVWIMHAAELDFVQKDIKKKKKVDKTAKIKKVAKHKVELASDLDEITHKVDSLTRPSR